MGAGYCLVPAVLADQTGLNSQKSTCLCLCLKYWDLKVCATTPNMYLLVKSLEFREKKKVLKTGVFFSEGN